MWIELAMMTAQIQLAQAERDRALCKGMTPQEREAYYARKEESRKRWEAEQSKKAAEAALAAEQEAIADATYRNPNHDLYDPLRVAKEKLGIKP